jgi:hypothetical protein
MHQMALAAPSRRTRQFKPDNRDVRGILVQSESPRVLSRKSKTCPTLSAAKHRPREKNGTQENGIKLHNVGFIIL